MIENRDISRMLFLLSSNLAVEVETHNSENWKNEDIVQLYECLQAAICKTQHQFCSQNDPDYLP